MKDTVSIGSTGFIAVAGGVVTSHAVVNEWLQTLSLVIGIAIGVVSLVSIIRKRLK